MNTDNIDELPISSSEAVFDFVAELNDGWRSEDCLAPTEICRERMRTIFRQLQAFDLPKAKTYLSDAGWIESVWTADGFETVLRVTDLGHVFLEIENDDSLSWHQDLSNHDNPASRIVECFRATVKGRFPSHVTAP